MSGVIAFCGSKGSGKSTTATIFENIVSKMNIRTEQLAFAGHLKNSCAKVFKLDMDLFLNPALKEKELDSYVYLTKQNITEVFKEFMIETYDYDKHIRPHVGQVFDTPRKLLQYVGTELMHPLDKLIHVNVTMKLKDQAKLSIITDLRFPQEFTELEGRSDFYPVYIKNDVAENKAKTDGHASEKGFFEFKDRCILIDNNGSLADLERNINKFIEGRFSCK